jgi:hypothetical protein
MARYMFVGFNVEPDASVEIPDEAIVVGANFSMGNIWQIMCLVPSESQARQAAESGPEPSEAVGGELEGGEEQEEDEDANVPPEP